MEILKDKKILVGGLAVIGGIALVAYLLKPKSPKQNSEGFFGADGVTIPANNPFGVPPKPFGGIRNITPPSVPENCNLPNTFTKKVYTDRGTKSYCGRYDRLLTKKGFVYRLQPQLNWTKSDGTGGQYPFVNGNFYNLNGGLIVTNPTTITYDNFENAWIYGEFCKQ